MNEFLLKKKHNLQLNEEIFELLDQNFFWEAKHAAQAIPCRLSISPVDFAILGSRPFTCFIRLSKIQTHTSLYVL